MILPPEQGRRTDLLKSSSLVSPNNFGGPVSGIRSCHPHPVSSQNINSDSVHYDPSTQVIVSSGSSCHTVDRLTESTEKDRQSPFPSYSLLAPPPPWVHVFSKSCANSSLRTQCAAAASLQVMSPTVFHRRIRRARKKQRKQDRMLHEIRVPPTQVLLSPNQIDSDIIVFDGGDDSTPPIRPPDGIKWRSIHVRQLYIPDVTDHQFGLSFPKINGASPFILLPRKVSLDIISACGLSTIYGSLHECEKLRRVSLSRSDRKRVFTDYGKQVTYACVGPQPSRNSNTVRDNPPFMDNLPQCHWRSLVWMMKRAEIAFREFADHAVISHNSHAKKLVPFKTFQCSGDASSSFSAEFFGGIAFGTNVFLRCHTDADFTMSISQVFLKGKDAYNLEDDVICYFCFPTLGVAVPLRPGDYFMFNALIPHCISSRCRLEDNVMCASVYLKTAVVGMNNNKLQLTSDQAATIELLHSSKNN
jgi:hypothetical protein